MKIQFVKSAEKKRILNQLEDQFGITKLPYLLIESGKEKIRAFSGNLSKEEISELSEIANIELIGLYLIKKDTPLRLSLDATSLLKSQITKNIKEISEEQMQDWLRGKDLQIKQAPATLVIKREQDLLGCGRSNENKIINHIPKTRRIKN